MSDEDTTLNVAFKPGQLEAIDLLARAENTHEQIAKEVGITRKTLWVWRKDVTFQNAVYETAMSYLQNEVPKVLDALAKQAKKGNTRAIELTLKHTGKYVEKADIGVAELKGPFTTSIGSTGD